MDRLLGLIFLGVVGVWWGILTLWERHHPPTPDNFIRRYPPFLSNPAGRAMERLIDQALTMVGWTLGLGAFLLLLWWVRGGK